MPILPWRTDADGFNFSNTWTLDATEQNTLAGLAAAAAPAAIAALVAVFPPIGLDAALMTILTSTASAAAYTIAKTLPAAQYGMCGGMAYTSLDYWHAKAAIPYGGNINDQPMRTTPPQTSLRNTIWSRLLDSLTSGGCLQKTIEWVLLLNYVPPTLGGGPGTLLSWTAQEWPKIKAEIDAGRPCPIGLIYANRDIWDQHQILVYGYDAYRNGARLYVYDNIFPHAFGETAFNQKDYLTFDLSGPALKATSPDDEKNSSLAGFFRTGYGQATPPAGLATHFGQFITFDSVTFFMTAYGALLRISGPAEFAALGGLPSDPRIATSSAPTVATHPRDNALLREHSAAPVFLYQGGAPFWVPDPTQLAKFGGWDAVRVVPDNTIAQFAGVPLNGTLLREISDSQVFLYNNGFAASPTVATSPDVRVVPDAAIRGRLLDKLYLDSSGFRVGSSCNATVSLKTAYPSADVLVTMTSSQPSLATVPTTVTIPKGALSSQPFKVTSTGAAPSPGNYSVQITGTVGGFSVSNAFLLEPPRITQFVLTPATVTAGQSSTAMLVFDTTYSGDLQIDLYSYSSFANVQANVILHKTALSVTFPVTTPPLNYAFVAQGAQIQASYANYSSTATLTVQPSVIQGIVQSLTFLPSPVTSGGSTTATVTLATAVNVPTDVSLTSYAPTGTVFAGPSPLIASMPSKITIPANQTQGHFTITTKAISAQATQRTAMIEAIAVKNVIASLTLKP